MLVPSGQIGDEATRLLSALEGVRAWASAAFVAVAAKFFDQPQAMGPTVLVECDGFTIGTGGDPAVERVAEITGHAVVLNYQAGLWSQRKDAVQAALIMGALVFDACSAPTIGSAASAQFRVTGAPIMGPTGEGKNDLAIRIPWRLRITLRVADHTEDYQQ